MKLKQAFKAFFKALKKEKCVTKNDSVPDQSQLRLLKSLQSSGRLVDFFKEDITSYSDAQVGVAARKIHAECAKTLEEILTIRPVYKEAENSNVTIPPGYNPKEVKVIGKVMGNPPYTGKLRHKGWRAHQGQEVIYPAEVEV